MKEKTLWIMCGIPGCGKTYVATRLMMQGSGWRWVSRDQIRLKYLQEGEEHFSHERAVFDEFIYRLREALNDCDTFDVIADATHLNWPSRRKLLRNLGAEYDLNKINIIPVVVYSSYETCVKRNAERTGRACVPVEIVDQMLMSYKTPKEDPFNYDAIMEWNNETNKE